MILYIYMYGYIIDRIISIYCSSYNDPILWRMRSSYFPTRLGRSLWPIKGWLRRDVGLRELQIIQNDGQNGYWRYWMILMIFPSESDVFVDVDIIYIYMLILDRFSTWAQVENLHRLMSIVSRGHPAKVGLTKGSKEFEAFGLTSQRFLTSPRLSRFRGNPEIDRNRLYYQNDGHRPSNEKTTIIYTFLPVFLDKPTWNNVSKSELSLEHLLQSPVKLKVETWKSCSAF